jgi:hypothetical protein
MIRKTPEGRVIPPFPRAVVIFHQSIGKNDPFL